MSLETWLHERTMLVQNYWWSSMTRSEQNERKYNHAKDHYDSIILPSKQIDTTQKHKKTIYIIQL